MRIIKFFYSLWFLGILFLIHIVKYFFRRDINAPEFLKRFSSDNIRMVDSQTVVLSIDASRCINCGICILNNSQNYLSGLEICSRISRDTTLLDRGQIKREKIFFGDCPYEIEISKISEILH